MAPPRVVRLVSEHDRNRDVEILVLVVVLQPVFENVLECHRREAAGPDMAGERKCDLTGGVDNHVPIKLRILQDRNIQAVTRFQRLRFCRPRGQEGNTQQCQQDSHVITPKTSAKSPQTKTFGPTCGHFFPNMQPLFSRRGN